MFETRQKTNALGKREGLGENKHILDEIYKS